MKISMVLSTTTPSNKEVSFKLSIAPRKLLGFVNFVDMSIKQKKDVILTFEKINTKGEREASKLQGTFKFEVKDVQELVNLRNIIEDKERKRKKTHLKRKYK